MDHFTIAKCNDINPSNIDNHHLTMSLLNEGMRIGLFSSNKIEHFQMELLNLLSNNILQYTNNQSSSVKVETAQDITGSILYNIDCYLLTLSSFEEAIGALQSTPVPELYKLGYKSIKILFEETKKLLQEVQNSKLSVPLAAYNDTINDGFTNSFDTYDMRFNSQNIDSVIDYPLLSDDMTWSGIIYIKNYLKNLKLENNFCKYFSQEDIILLLEHCGYTFKLTPTDLVVNISELVLKNSIGSVLIGKNASNLIITEEDCILLETYLKNFNSQQLLNLLQKTFETIFTELNFIDSTIKLYFKPFIDSLYPQLLNALHEQTLDGLFTVINNSSISNHILYQEGKMLSDKKLRELIDELKICQTGKEKAAIIQTEIHNIEDLIAVFNSYCIYDEEYTFVFDKMGDYELGLLAFDLFDHSPSLSNIDFNTNNRYLSENELYWKKKLVNYIKSLDINRLSNIIQLVKNLTKY